MADQKKWFKVWTTLLIDSLSTKIDDIGRFTVLGCLIASRGENGKLVTDRKTLQMLLQCNEISPKFIKEFNIILEEIEDTGNGNLSVTFKNWNKYQVDSTGYDRQQRYRDSHSVTAKVTAKVTAQDKIRRDKNREEESNTENIALFLTKLKENPAYKKIDVGRELSKMDAWLLTPKGKGRKKTKAFIVNWLNKIDVEINTQGECLNDRYKPL